MTDEKEKNLVGLGFGYNGEYTQRDVNDLKAAAEEWSQAVDMVLAAANVYHVAQRRYADIIGRVTACQGREMEIGLEMHHKTGDATVIDRYQHGAREVHSIDKELRAKLKETKGIGYVY